MKELGVEKYFGIFHGEKHPISELGQARAAAEAEIASGVFAGHHFFDFDETGQIRQDVLVYATKSPTLQDREEWQALHEHKLIVVPVDYFIFLIKQKKNEK